MSSLFNHIFIPVVILLLFSKNLKLNSREVAALSFFAVLPDLDFFFAQIEPIPLHRALFHNVFMLVIPLLLFIIAKSRREVFGIICFYLTSHFILDLFTGGIFLFYPVYNNVFFVNIELLFNFKPVIEYGISNEIMNMGRGEPVISSENVAIALILITFFTISVHEIYRKTKSK